MIYPIRTRRLSISPLTKLDLEQFVAYRQDPKVAQFQSWDTSYSEEQALKLIDAQVNVEWPEPGEWLQLALHLNEGAELLGDVALHRLAEDPLTIELGFTLASKNQGFGYAKEAIAGLMAIIIETRGAKKFLAHVDERNLRATNLLRSLGFLQILDKRWTEKFKGETVIVDYFEKVIDSPNQR